MIEDCEFRLKQMKNPVRPQSHKIRLKVKKLNKKLVAQSATIMSTENELKHRKQLLVTHHQQVSLQSKLSSSINKSLRRMERA